MERGSLKNGFVPCVRYTPGWQRHNSRWNILTQQGAVGEGVTSSGENFICEKKILQSSYQISLGSPLLNLPSGGCFHPSCARAVVHLLDRGCQDLPSMREAPAAAPTAVVGA